MRNSRELRLRHQVALEAARIMAGEGVQDFLLAKRKAASRLGVSVARFLPRNIEIKNALVDYQRLFQSKTQPNQLRALRETALEVMQLLSAFRPYLTGEVLEGTADQYSGITLHLFADAPEEVVFFLTRNKISYRTRGRRLRVYQDQYKEYPDFQFIAGDHCVDLVVFPVNGLRQAPISPADKKPMSRASLAAVQAMLNA